MLEDSWGNPICPKTLSSPSQYELGKLRVFRHIRLCCCGFRKGIRLTATFTDKPEGIQLAWEWKANAMLEDFWGNHLNMKNSTCTWQAKGFRAYQIVVSWFLSVRASSTTADISFGRSAASCLWSFIISFRANM
jgi:hypothetical protein